MGRRKNLCQLVCKYMQATPSEIQSGCHLGRGCYYEAPVKCGLWVAMQNKPCPQTSRHRLALDLLADTPDTHTHTSMFSVIWAMLENTLHVGPLCQVFAGNHVCYELLCKIKRNADIKMHVEASRAMCH